MTLVREGQKYMVAEATSYHADLYDAEGLPR
jgi:hypothetical protein